MFSFLKLGSAVIFWLVSLGCYGQWHVVAVSSTGILINNPDLFYTQNKTVTFPKGGTITPEDAKSIFALNIILVDSKKKLFRAKITRFKMSVYDTEGEHAFDSNSEMLTPEMKEQLQKIRPGNKLYFEYIDTEMPDGSHPPAAMLGFTVK